jgi:hypothetical protein
MKNFFHYGYEVMKNLFLNTYLTNILDYEIVKCITKIHEI